MAKPDLPAILSAYTHEKTARLFNRKLPPLMLHQFRDTSALPGNLFISSISRSVTGNGDTVHSKTFPDIFKAR